jgi:hypothetical protein
MGKASNYVRGSLEERFWVKVDRRGDDECWEWRASLDTRGYGNFGVPRNDGTGRFIMQRAHRIAWELANGPLQSSAQHLCHTCDNRKCVNPAHMFIGNPKLNMADCAAKGRLGDRRGENNPRAKLTEDEVRMIRASSKPYSELAKEHGVVKSVIGYAKSGVTWAHL